MMTLEIFLLLLMIISVMNGLFTEAVKKFMEEINVKYKANLLAGAVAAVLSVLIGTGYIILTEAHVNEKLAVMLIALMLLSWLSAMVGYDKVIQAISQFKINKKE